MQPFPLFLFFLLIRGFLATLFLGLALVFFLLFVVLFLTGGLYTTLFLAVFFLLVFFLFFIFVFCHPAAPLVKVH